MKPTFTICGTISSALARPMFSRIHVWSGSRTKLSSVFWASATSFCGLVGDCAMAGPPPANVDSNIAMHAARVSERFSMSVLPWTIVQKIPDFPRYPPLARPIVTFPGAIRACFRYHPRGVIGLRPPRGRSGEGVGEHARDRRALDGRQQPQR